MAIRESTPTKFVPAAQSLYKRSENPRPGINIDSHVVHNDERVRAGHVPHCEQSRAISLPIAVTAQACLIIGAHATAGSKTTRDGLRWQPTRALQLNA